MYFTTTITDSASGRAFIDEIDYNPSRDAFSSAALRAAGAFGGGILFTALLAVFIHN